MSQCIIVSVTHTHRRHKYITLWRSDNAGYAWPLPWAGRYDQERVMPLLRDYYNTGETLTVPAELVEELASPVDAGDIDGNVGPAVRNTAANWKRLLASVIAEPTRKPQPKYKGARRTKDE